MELTYDNYPMLSFLSYGLKDASKQIPFEVEDENANNYLENSSLLTEILNSIDLSRDNQIAVKHKYYLLSEELELKINSNTELFFQRETRDFILSSRSSCLGTICMAPNWQYTFMYLEKPETKNLKGLDEQYISVAIFRENTFIGVEEAFVTNRGFKIQPTGYYPKGEELEPGCYITFLVVLLSCINKSKDLQLVDKNLNKTTETVFLII